MAKSSNEKRALLKQQCREALAAHIHDRLGLVIAPAQVRLQPPPEDGYAWSVTEPMAFLLQSNLSSGTVGLLQTICKELGRSLEAVSPQVLQEQLNERRLPLSFPADVACSMAFCNHKHHLSVGQNGQARASGILKGQ
ncbi:hypothetical protein CBS147337_10036 [Penicillium roqueforti]|nr:hypothetical protein CBS147337_10036 [Penicillium roqueforti]